MEELTILAAHYTLDLRLQGSVGGELEGEIRLRLELNGPWETVATVHAGDDPWSVLTDLCTVTAAWREGLARRQPEEDEDG